MYGADTIDLHDDDDRETLSLACHVRPLLAQAVGSMWEALDPIPGQEDIGQGGGLEGAVLVAPRGEVSHGLGEPEDGAVHDTGA